MDLPGVFVRGGAGLLYAGFGLFILLVGGLSRRNRALGVLLLFSSLSLIAINASSTDEAVAANGTLVAAALTLPAVVAGWLLFRDQVRTMAARRTLTRVVLANLVLVAVGSAMLYQDRANVHSTFIVHIAPPLLLWLYFSLFALFWALFAASAMASAEALRDPALPERQAKAHALLAFNLASQGVFVAGAAFTRLAVSPLAATWGSVLMVAFAYPAILWGLRATAGPHGRLARNVVLALVAYAMAGILFGLIPEVSARGTATGIVRILAFPPLAYAVLQLDALGIGLRPRTIRAGTLASVGLATLFIAAQVAQNFLSSALGLALGGVVAGAVVFAIFPLQRLAERAVERRRQHAGGVASPAARYRRQVEVAWVDGRLGANERLMLAEARRQLGLDADTAAGIDEDVARMAATRRRTTG